MTQENQANRDLTMEITAHLQYLAVIRSFIGCLARDLNFKPDDALQLELCVDEACANSICAIQDSEGPESITKLRLDIQINDTCLRITIHDSGKDFARHFHKALPLTDESDRTRQRGYGLQIIKTFMDDVQYVRDPSVGNQLLLTKYFTQSQG